MKDSIRVNASQDRPPNSHRANPPHPAAAAGAPPKRPLSRRPLPPPEARAIVLGTRNIPYILRISARARVLRFIIRPGRGLEVVAPRGTSRERIEQALHEKAAWIATTLDRVERETAAAAPPPLVDGLLLPCAGRTLTLRLQTGAPAGRFRARLSDGILTLTLADLAQDTIRAALTRWYRHEAHVLFAERLAVWNATYRFAYGRVSIKEQKSRWGSCSRQGNLNFNWRLLLAPLPVLDYVVIHELCHLKEMNHSAQFWQLVSVSCPTYSTHRRWLRQHGHRLCF
ncbi:MAG TPA: SprT family zinc-dependent metalloprotease [Ktedonobacterales bacterium]|nr:SprT family zinc-dependent metalloprotease [Ktedonobacterales bacterium]